MNKLIESGEELLQHFHNLSKASKHHQKEIHSGVYVTTKIRRDILTSFDQGKITLNGQVCNIKFWNYTGGVFCACVEDYEIN